MRFAHELLVRLNGHVEADRGDATVFRVRIPASSLHGE
jgi:hypothetical protein